MHFPRPGFVQPITVDTAAGLAAVGEQLGDAALEDIGVIAALGTGRLWLREIQQGAQLGEEHLQVGGFIAAPPDTAAPTLDVRLNLLLNHTRSP